MVYRAKIKAQKKVGQGKDTESEWEDVSVLFSPGYSRELL